VREIAWNGQLRLSKRFAQLQARGVQMNKACVAVARELAGFVWAVGPRRIDEMRYQTADTSLIHRRCNARAASPPRSQICLDINDHTRSFSGAASLNKPVQFKLG
jgi:hypothetical protein